MKEDLLPFGCWAAEDRPTNKIESIGVRGLSTSELLSVIIGNGGYKTNPVEIARKLLAKYDNDLTRIANLSIEEMTEVPGIGEATAKIILASLDLGRRAFAATKNERKDISSATAVYNEMLPHLSNLEVEEFWVLLLNQRYGLIKKVRIGQGGITECPADIRLIVKEALLANATVIAVCHNHPSGRPLPSRNDDRLTENIKKACDTMRLHLLDHVIVCDGSYYSYHEQGKL